MFLPATNVIIKLHKKLILHTEYAYVFVAILVHPYEIRLKTGANQQMTVNLFHINSSNSLFTFVKTEDFNQSV